MLCNGVTIGFLWYNNTCYSKIFTLGRQKCSLELVYAWVIFAQENWYFYLKTTQNLRHTRKIRPTLSTRIKACKPIIQWKIIRLAQNMIKKKIIISYVTHPGPISGPFEPHPWPVRGAFIAKSGRPELSDFLGADHICHIQIQPELRCSVQVLNN